ncbi:MAG: hypothetical protein NXI04_27675 [Planctomycetaceae bacterium]|nr:hypothetical protein [Planctomycetaceae bacterium]
MQERPGASDTTKRGGQRYGNDRSPFAPPQSGHDPVVSLDDSLPARWLWIHTLAVMAGAVGCFAEVETVTVTGVIISLTGIFLTRAARRCGNPPGVLLGLSGPGVSVASLIVINLLEWSPQEADVPMKIVAAVYTPGVLFLQRQAERVAEQRERERLSAGGQPAAPTTDQAS